MIVNSVSEDNSKIFLILQMITQYFMRECENILCGYLYDGDLVFVILKGIYGFKLPKRFLVISSRDLTTSSSLLLFFFS